MSSKKKVAIKATEQKAKFRIGLKVFFIKYNTKNGEILEGEIISIQGTQFAEKDIVGKVVGYTTLFDYFLSTARGDMEVQEYNIYPTYTEAAKSFAKSFLTLLK